MTGPPTAATVRPIDSIEPQRLYALGEARLFLPSARGGPLCLKTLHRWRQQGLLKCVSRTASDGRQFWFVWGAEILRLLPVAELPTPVIEGPAARSRAAAKVVAGLAQHIPGLLEDKT